MTVDDETRDLVARALVEDLRSGDVTAESVIDEAAMATAVITQKQPGVVFGLEVAADVFRQTGADDFESRAAEEEWREGVPAEIARISGAARPLLAAERTAIN